MPSEAEARAVERTTIGARDRIVICTHRPSRLKKAKIGCNAALDLHHLFKALLLTESLSEQYVNLSSCRCASDGEINDGRRKRKTQ
jgi:hypothetical protein